MEILYYIYLFVLGTLFGSFSSVIISRLYENKSGIFGGRSECPKCKHRLAFYDLFPIFSFLSTGGKCRYCKSKISIVYPILEIVLGILFVLTSYFLIDFGNILLGDKLEIIKLFFFSSLVFFSFIFVVYDIKYLLIPESILAILVGLAFLGISLQTFVPGFNLIDTLPHFSNDINITNKIIFLIVGIITIGVYYTIMLKELDNIYDILLLVGIVLIFGTIKLIFNINLTQTALGSGIISSFFIFLFFYVLILVSGGAWMGGGDLRIAILLGLITGATFGFPAMLITYISGSIIGIFVLTIAKIANKNKKNTMMTQIPFGPFLAIGLFSTLFFQDNIYHLIEIYFNY